MNDFMYQKSQWISRFNCPAEQQMREGFIAIAQEVVSEKQLYCKDNKTIYAGIELELPLVADNFYLAPQAIRDEIVACFPNYTSVELGAHQLEIIHEPPVDIYLAGIRSLEESLQSHFAPIFKHIQKGAIKIICLGCYPLGMDEFDYTKGDPKYIKYEQSPVWHMDNQRNDAIKILEVAEKVDVSNAYIVGLMNSVQITVDAQNFTDAIDKLNRSLMISPLAVALGANAPYLNLLDTGYADVRFLAWEISHDSRSHEEVANGRQTRVGLPRRYYGGLNDYFNRILSYPFVMDDPISLKHPFEVGNGLYWRDARLKFFRDKKTIAVEFRPVSLQPTLHEDIAMMIFYLGRLFWSQHKNETLLPMKYVRENKLRAMKYGLNTKLYILSDFVISSDSATTILAREINRAEEGLLLLGAKNQDIKYFFDPLRKRLLTGSPAECFVKKVKHYEKKMGRREALIAAIKQTEEAVYGQHDC
ncbi:MAG: glutamate-cysteine ligase family protein [bacterium]